MPTLISKVVCSKASANPSLKEHLEVAEYVAEFPETMKMSPITLFDRVIWRKAVKEGKGVIEMAGPSDKAVEELTAFYNQVFDEKFKAKAKKGASK